MIASLFKQIEAELKIVVKTALAHLDGPGVDNIVQFLVSDKVGITSLDELSDVEAKWLEPLKLPPIKLRKLLQHFSGSSTTDQPGKF